MGAAPASTIRALNDPARPPRRSPRLIALSARLPVPLLLGLRLATRRPRRSILAAVSLVIMVAMIVAGLTMRYGFDLRNSVLVGIPAGLALYRLAAAGASHGHAVPLVPPLWWLVAVVPGTLLMVAVLTAIPARIGARRPAAVVLRAE
jgi:hypothetical protein